MHVHIIGAGLSGLAAAVRLAQMGQAVSLYEGAGHAGGRCRSFHDRTLDRLIDNGNHLIMSGNKSALAYLDRIRAEDPLIGPDQARYPFVDIASGARWVVRMNEGFIPFWIFDAGWRVPGTGVMDYARAAAIAFAGPDKTVAEVVGEGGALYKNFWEPLTLAVLNATPQQGQARLLWSVIRETFLLGGQASRPRVAREGLGPAFIDPAVRYLQANGARLHVNARLRAVEMTDNRVTRLNFASDDVDVAPDDKVIFAIPPSRLKSIFPVLDPPPDDASILNVHYRLREPVSTEALNGSPFIALVSSDTQWIFVRDDIVSLTVSASHAVGMDDIPNDEAVQSLWREVQIALRLGDQMFDAVRVIRERRATPDQSPAGVEKRLKPQSPWSNVILAGDHTDTGVPATIEGSIRSGDRAAALARGQRA